MSMLVVVGDIVTHDFVDTNGTRTDYTIKFINPKAAAAAALRCHVGG